MKRYIYSFILALFIYTSLFASTFYLTKDKEISKSSKEQIQEINRVKISFVEPIKTEPKTIKKIVKKPVEKKIIKKIEKKIIKKIEQKTIKKIEEPIKKKEVIVKKEPKIQKQSPKKTASKTIKKDKDLEAKKIKELQSKYFSKISQTINKNKSYPRRAILRYLQDDIKIEFMISPKGELISFNIIDGKKIFYKSTKKAIEKSFPLTPPNGILSSNTKLKLTLSYRLN